MLFGILLVLGTALTARASALVDDNSPQNNNKAELCSNLNEGNCLSTSGTTLGCAWIPLIRTCMFVDRGPASILRECHELLSQEECVDPLYGSSAIAKSACEWTAENKCTVSTSVIPDSIDLASIDPHLGRTRAAKVIRKKPSFLILFADDVGYGDVSYINPTGLYTTPNIDAMAAHPNALKMNNFHCPAITCSPSRSSLLSGVYNVRECVWSANVRSDHPNKVFNPEFPYQGKRTQNMVNIARKQGYKTLFLGKWHISNPLQITSFGYDTWLAAGGNVPTFDMSCFCHAQDLSTCEAGHYYKTPDKLSTHYNCNLFQSPRATQFDIYNKSTSLVLVDKFIQYLNESLAPEDAFFVQISFPESHAPFIAPPQIRKKLMDGPLKNIKDTYKALKAADYYGSMMVLDEAVGRARRALAKYNRVGDTFVIFSSDNGPEIPSIGNGSPGKLRGWKRSMYEGGHRVPGIIVWPGGIPVRRETNSLISMLDVTATIIDILSQDDRKMWDSLSRTRLDGRSFLGQLVRLPGTGAGGGAVAASPATATWNRNSTLFICAQNVVFSMQPCPLFAAMDSEYKIVAKVNPSLKLDVAKTEFYKYDGSEYKQANKTGPRYLKLLNDAVDYTIVIREAKRFCKFEKE